jgi:hypothetical protein
MLEVLEGGGQGSEHASATKFRVARLRVALRALEPSTRMSHLLYNASETAADDLRLPAVARFLEVLSRAIGNRETDWLEGKDSPIAAAEAYLRRRRREHIDRLRRLASDQRIEPKKRMRLNAAAQRVGDETSELEYETVIAPNRPALLRELARAFRNVSRDTPNLEGLVAYALGVFKIHKASLVLEGEPTCTWGKLAKTMLAKCEQVANRDDASPELYVRALLRGWGVPEQKARNWVDGARIDEKATPLKPSP